MTSLVVELQRDALDSKVSIADLIKKAYVVARKLNIPDFQNWLQNEMNRVHWRGYSTGVSKYKRAGSVL
ncbi:hypothetical protein PVOR_01910 [Paenibacillus vortex V453]|uniref:AbiTii domain-containing protein n=1 Tax=Paenibacillus vortex V453 TaxID=715225 RepID=A0A2R9T2W5_9BACL|nr:hypothetical protein PVOR_01910 [Paenibacillus vortex V453]